MTIAYFFIIGLCIAGFIGLVLLERSLWNKGTCKQSGEPWRAFDTDSSGATGYTDGKGNYIWLSWTKQNERRS